MRICDIPGCGRKHMALGLCDTHYQAQRREAQRARRVEAGLEPPGLWSGQVVHILGVSRRTVERMVERGDLTAERSPGGNFRIDPESVRNWITIYGQLDVPDEEIIEMLDRLNEVA